MNRVFVTFFIFYSLFNFLQAQENDLLEVYDYAPDIPRATVEQYYNDLNLEIDIAYNERVQAFINYFTVRNRGYTREMLNRKDIYFPIFEKYLAQYNLPDELKYLPIIESGLNPGAVSGPQAVGLWQFMLLTGREQGLKVDWYIDERMDPERATEAACKYISWLYGVFNDWKLTLAAYNSGIGNVKRAMRRAGNKNDFWDIYRYLPRETRSYVPQFSAMIYAMEYADVHNLYATEPDVAMPYVEVPTKDFVYLNTFSNSTGIDLEVLTKLNPAIKKGAIPEHWGGYTLRIPQKNALAVQPIIEDALKAAAADKKEFEKMAVGMPGSTFGKEKIIYRVRSGDVLGTIAQRHQVKISDLRTWNNINGSMIRVGQRLEIYTGPDFYISSKTTQKVNQPIPDSKLHVVQPGDTLWDISRMYRGVSIARIKELNNLKSNTLKPGMKLRIG